ncbi:helix-turn-helix domain-containing protein [Actinomycetaceae bacterium MB13-C1-2]|nr:helix-turn-helix domain-containing protein [Actinomycetaceae bacterium MB13-C1-2]
MGHRTEEVEFAPDVLESNCPSRRLLRDVTGRWAPLVLISLDDGISRFGDLHRAIGGSNERMLSQTLTTLVGDGFVTRDQGTNERPVYGLTEGGREIARQLKALRDAVYDHLNASDASPTDVALE